MYISEMSRLLDEAEFPVPLYMEAGYAALVIRTVLGRGHVDPIEEAVVRRLYVQDINAFVDSLHPDPDFTPPLNRSHFEEVVAYVLGHITPDGYLEYLDHNMQSARTDHPRSIAHRLWDSNPFVHESHVRRAHAIQIERGSRVYRSRRQAVA